MGGRVGGGFGGCFVFLFGWETGGKKKVPSKHRPHWLLFLCGDAYIEGSTGQAG